MMSERGALGEVVALFTKLGVIGFGGPAAHIALMREEVVRRRRWISDERFLDLLGMTNLIPGYWPHKNDASAMPTAVTICLCGYQASR